MSDIRFRVVFEGLKQGIKINKPVAFLCKEIGLSKGKIQGMLTNPPCVLLEVSARRDAEKVWEVLKKMGCKAYIEPMISGSSYPFAISQEHYRDIKKELGKALRMRGNVALSLVQVEAKEPQSMVPSMLGDLGKRLSEHFRESDTVIAIDDSRVILLGFSNGRETIGDLREKIEGDLKDQLGEGVEASMGFSLFPEEGQSLPKLLQVAEKRRKEGGEPGDRAGYLSVDTPYVLAKEGGTLTPIQVCFTEARGKIFRRLLNMDPQSLLLGLSTLPQNKQREFLARLPFDSPIASILEEAIEGRTQVVSEEISQEDLGTIMYYMELEEGLEERKKNQEEILSMLNRTEALPTLPSIASHVLMIASNPDASASDLTEVIINDPSLTSTLLKIVNSAYYGFRQKISSVKQAVVLLGTGEIIALSFGLSTAKLFNIAHLEGAYTPQSLWRHSMCTGLIAENLCKRFPEYRKLGVFTAGLLHDFGKILLIDNFPELYGKVHAESRKYNIPLFELEEEKFGLTHAMIGEFLALNWNLPEALVQAIAFHHQPFSASSHSQLASIIGLADYLYYEATLLGELPEEFPGYSCELTSCHWSFLSQLFPALDTEKLEKMIEEALDVIKHSEELFSILEK